MKKLDYVDALRGLAILGVVMVHTNQYGSNQARGIYAAVIGQGAKGVQLFYVVSAFTLFLSFHSRFKKEILPVKNFFIRRFFRIAPMYYIGICYYLFQEGLGPRFWLGDQTHVTPLNIISNFTFLHGFYPYWINSVVPGGWSIGIEMTFYLVLPFLFSKIKTIQQAVNLFLLSLFVQVVLHVILMRFPLPNAKLLWDEFLALYFPSQMPIFSLGLIMYFIIVKKETARNISLSSFLIFGALVLAQLFSGSAALLIGHTFFAIGFLMLGTVLSRHRFRLLVNPVITYIGKISFSMYLVHFAVLHWLVQLGFVSYFNNPILNYIAKLTVVCILTAAISTVFYRLIEIPFQNIGKAIIAKSEKKMEQTPDVLQNMS